MSMKILLTAALTGIGMLVLAPQASAAGADQDQVVTTSPKVVHHAKRGYHSYAYRSGTERHRLTTGRSNNGHGQEPGSELIQDRDQRRSN
jgi:hypothetical protein